MLKTFTAAVLALSLIAGPAFAQGGTPAPTNNAPVTAGQPAKTGAKQTSVAPANKGKTAKAHVRHVKHVKHTKLVKQAKHAKHGKQVKGVKQSTEKTRG